MDKAKKLKVFYHPSSAIDNIIETFGERYFFIGKPKAVLEALQRERLNFEHYIPQPFTWKDFELCHAPGRDKIVWS